MRILRSIAIEVGRLHRKGHQVIITHGNGPQVGKLFLEEGENFALLTAQTEAEIGLEIEKALEKYGRVGKSAIVITRVEVDPGDSEFGNPSKPVGRFYSRAEAVRARKHGYRIKRLIGGYRLVVPSPKPKRILDLESISALLSNGYIVIAGGGGGVAVSGNRNGHSYLNAVIDKDYTSSLLASSLKADRLFILTNVDSVYLDFRRKGQRRIIRAGASEMNRYLRLGEFERGSMLPKVASCISFARSRGRSATIGSIKEAKGVLEGRSGSTIIP